MVNRDNIRLWTIQTKDIWDNAKKSGVLDFNKNLIEEENDPILTFYRPAYNWMVVQLEQRLKNYPKKKFPIWA